MHQGIIYDPTSGQTTAGIPVALKGLAAGYRQGQDPKDECFSSVILDVEFVDGPTATLTFPARQGRELHKALGRMFDAIDEVANCGNN